MKKALIGATIIALGLVGYACKDDDESPITVTSPVQLTATLNGASGGSTTSGGTGTFTGSLNQGTTAGSAQSSNVLSYTVNYAGITPTGITLDPVGTSTSAITGTSAFSNSILLAGAFPSTITSPGSGTSTIPGSGTSTIPGSGTSTTPGSGTSTTPGSGTTTDPGSGTSTTPGSGTSTTPGSGTSTTPGSGSTTTPGSGTGVTITSPVSGTVSVSQSRADSISRGLYQLNIRSATYPNGEIGGAVRVR